MKQLIFSFLKVLLVASFVLINSNVYSQDFSMNPDVSSPVCPGVSTLYTLSTNLPYHTCWIKWNVVNGIIAENGTNEYSSVPSNTSIHVTWNNTLPDGKITVTYFWCDDASAASAGKTQTFTYHVKSLLNLTPTAINGSSNILFGQTTQINYSSSLKYYYTGTPIVNSYKWKIPIGWQIWYNNQLVTSTGQEFTGLTGSISVFPDNTTGGTIKVWGETGCGYFSDPQSLSVTRSFPAITAQVTTTNTYLQGDLAPITLSVPNWTYAQYNWSIPANWHLQGSNTNSSVTVIPDGCIGATPTCLITVANQTKTVSKEFSDFLHYPRNQVPTISGNNFLCTNETYSITNLPLRTTSIIWSLNPSINLISGQGTQTVNISKDAGASGSTPINLTLAVGGCPSFALNARTIWAGTPVISSQVPLSYFDGYNYNNVCNQQAASTDMIIDGTNSVYWDRIAANPEITSWYQSDKNINFNFFAVNQTAVFQVIGFNICGSTYYSFGFKSVDCSGGGGGGGGGNPCQPVYAISPNPTSNKVTIIPNIIAPCPPVLAAVQTKSVPTGTISLYNNQGLLKKRVNYKYMDQAEIDVSNLQNGLYHIEIFDGTHFDKKTIIIQH